MREVRDQRYLRGVFKRNKKSLEVKIIAGLLYFFGLSLRKTSIFISLFEEISHEYLHEYLRKYYQLRYILKQPRKRKLIAVDETIIRVGDWRVYEFMYGLL